MFHKEITNAEHGEKLTTASPRNSNSPTHLIEVIDVSSLIYSTVQKLHENLVLAARVAAGGVKLFMFYF